jgi:hypothetical protein
MGRICTKDSGLSGRRLIDAREQADRGRLATATGADQAKDGTRGNLERKAVDGHGLIKNLGELLRLNNTWGLAAGSTLSIDHLPSKCGTGHWAPGWPAPNSVPDAG